MNRRNVLTGIGALLTTASIPSIVAAKPSLSRAYSILRSRLVSSEKPQEHRQLLWTFINRKPQYFKNVLSSRSGCRRVYCPALPYMSDAQLQEKGITKAMAFDHLCQLMDHTLKSKNIKGVYSVFNYVRRGNSVLLYAEVKT